MGLLSTLTRRPVRGFLLLRRILVELRRISRALERQADVLELAHTGKRQDAGGQVFRSYARVQPGTEAGQGSEVAYCDDRTLAAMMVKEEELTALLGRAPTEVELERAYAGDVEVRG